MKNVINLVYLVSHPIQYQAPLLRMLEKQPEINLLVLFKSDFSVRQYKDKGFGKTIEWDVPLLEGYRYQVLSAVGSNDKVSTFKPLNYGLRKALKEFNADVLWLHGYATAYDWYAMVLAKMLGIKLMVRGDSSLFAISQSKMKACGRSLFFKILARTIDAFLAVGQSNRDFYLHFGVPESKIFSAPYTVDNDYFKEKSNLTEVAEQQLRVSLGLKHDWPVILYASKLQQRKCADQLLEAFTRLPKNENGIPKAYLLFVGDGELMPALKARVDSLQWDNIKLLGFKNQSELPGIFKLTDLFVLPSMREPYGLIVNEVMNAGCALLVTDEVGAAYDLVDQGKNGYIYKAGNVAQLTEKLAAAVADVSLLKTMGQQSLLKIKSWGLPETVAGIVQACQAIT